MAISPNLTHVAQRRGYTQLRRLAEGIEFVVFEAQTPGGEKVVLRTPRGARFSSNANDRFVDARRLLRWEFDVCTYLTGVNFPVAAPREFVPGDPDVLISEYLPDDDLPPDPTQLGVLLKELHALPGPAVAPAHAEGMAATELVPLRIGRRWRELDRVTGSRIPAAPDVELLGGCLAAASTMSLLHLDIRADNLRSMRGRIQGVLDWSNALVADPKLEIARLAEYARFPANGLDLAAVLDGYGESEPDDAAYWVYRLDAAVMLALVFTSEAPDERQGESALEQLAHVRQKLSRVAG